MAFSFDPLQALYSGLTAAASARIPVFHPPLAVSLPYPWGSQYLMPPCGTPIAYAPMYPHGGIYAQPAMATGSVYIAAEAERRLAEKKSKEESWNGGEGMKASSESAKEDASQSVNIESEGSSSTGLQEEVCSILVLVNMTTLLPNHFTVVRGLLENSQFKIQGGQYYMVLPIFQQQHLCLQWLDGKNVCINIIGCWMSVNLRSKEGSS